jgi:4-diphosphocytidyl-2-C-methyl-D-erythritol kinase
MLSFPNCKINIGLNITHKREDGFHDLETIFYPIYNYKEALEIIEAKEFSIKTTGTNLQIDVEANIVTKAFRIIKNEYKIPNIKIHLHKTLPFGAGLGGGSADASFMLQLLNKNFELNISEEQLLNFALQLGSDCPFFIKNKPMYAQGRGEIFEEINLNLAGKFICVITPNMHISTADAFKNIKPNIPKQNLKNLVEQPIQNWQDTIVNDFEKTVFIAHPKLTLIKKNLYANGALYASLSGSGSSVYGIFENEIDTHFLSKTKHHFHFCKL